MPIVADPTAYNASTAFQVDLSKLNWQAVGLALGDGAKSRCHLLTTIRIGGADHHLEAIQVTEVDGEQSGVDGSETLLEDLAMFEADTGDGPFETVSIEGRIYVLCLTPFRS